MRARTLRQLEKSVRRAQHDSPQLSAELSKRRGPLDQRLRDIAADSEARPIQRVAEELLGQGRIPPSAIPNLVEKVRTSTEPGEVYAAVDALVYSRYWRA